MIPRDHLPEDAADWSTIKISFPRLANDGPDSCPYSPDDIFEYVQIESGDVDKADRNRLVFLRTAQVGEAEFWLWLYTESDGETIFVTYQIGPDCCSSVALANPNGLSTEQFLLAQYYDEVYWS